MKKILCFVKYHTDLDDLLRQIYFKNRDAGEFIEKIKTQNKECLLVTNLGAYKVIHFNGADSARGHRCNKVYLDPRYTIEELYNVFLPCVINMEDSKYKDDYIELLYDYI